MGRTGKAVYDIIYVMADGTTVLKRKRGAPRPEELYRARPLRDTGSTMPEAVFVVRFMPSRQRWVAYYLPAFQMRGMVHGVPIMSCPQTCFQTPDRDATIMACTLQLGLR